LTIRFQPEDQLTWRGEPLREGVCCVASTLLLSRLAAHGPGSNNLLDVPSEFRA